MKKKYFKRFCDPNINLFIVVLFAFFSTYSQAQQLRRPVSPEQPMWLIHIDTWNYADPQKIIDLIPEDIRPYVVMNISLSISHDVATSRFQVAEYGNEIAKSWLRTCAQNRMWAMIQVASGGYTQFSDHDLSLYEQYFQDYPNLIGFNYAEQFWGYDDPNDPLSPSWPDRITHFANLLELSHEYGAYLTVSWCGNQYSPGVNPIAMLKQNEAFANACRLYTENYILCEKYTLQTYQNDMESICLGSYLSGYSGAYGIRYDNTGWTNASGQHEDFSMATALAPSLEHVMLTGETVIDGPELIWTQCFKETNPVAGSDGYTSRQWETFPQFDNVSVEIFRKIIDGTVRIPSRQEVIDRTKYVVVNDVASGTNDDKYSTPQTLFEGLYRMDNDGNLANNKSFFKKTGRYPTVPTVYQLDDELANSFEHIINKSDYGTVWPTIQDKVAGFNAEFEEEYTGDIYASRHENGWVVYNPFKTGQIAVGTIPFKYNTCDSLEVSFSQYSAAVVKETANGVNFYLNNYDNFLNGGLKIDVIKIYGSTQEPTYTFTERANHQFSRVTSAWQDGVFTLTVHHNGALDVSVNCSGAATERLTEYTGANLITPVKPQVYTGPLQYEAEVFDRKNVASVITNGYSGNIRNYTGQGYLGFGTSVSASVRDIVTVLNNGRYQLDIRYTLQGVAVNTIDIYINGQYVLTPEFIPIEDLNIWATNTQFVDLQAGQNIIEFRANAISPGSVYFDNIVVTNADETFVWLEAECGAAGSLWDFVNDGESSNNQYVRVPEGNNSNTAAPSDENGYITYNFTVGDAGTYTLWGRTLSTGDNSNSFWLRMDGGEWIHWDSTTSDNEWSWNNGGSFEIGTGTHTLTIAFSEGGTGLDKLYLTNTNTPPAGTGELVSGACENIADTGIILAAAASGENIGLTWSLSNVSWASQEVYRSTDSNFANSEQIAIVDATALTYTDETVIADELYYYWIKGIAAGGNYLVSNPANAGISSDVWIEAECAAVGELWNTFSDFTAANEYYVMPQTGLNSATAAPTGVNDAVSFNFTVGTAGSYALWLRVKCPSVEDNSFWIKIDNGEWVSWNNIAVANSWVWAMQNTHVLAAGTHTVYVAYQEDGAKLDKLHLTRLGNAPLNEGAETIACEVIQDTAIILSSSLANNQILLNWELENTTFTSQQVYRSLDNNFNNSTLIATLDGVTENYTDIFADPGVLYYYWVKGINSDESSLLSNNVSAVTEYSAGDIWMEVECGEVGSLFNITTNVNTSNGYYVTVQPGNNSASAAPTNSAGHIVLNFNVTESGTYKLWARAQSPSANDDSFYFKVDTGNWAAWNGMNGSSNWSWAQFQSYVLEPGNHTLTIAYREDGANIDKIYLTRTTLVPADFGGQAETCSPPRVTLTANVINSEIILNWNVENIELQSHEIYRSLTSNFSDSVLLTTLANTVFSYTDETAQINATYYYWIKGIHSNGTILSNAANTIIETTDTDVWLEAECGAVGSLWNRITNQDASNGYFAVIQDGNTNSSTATADPNGHIVFNYDIAEADRYTLWARVKCPSASDDSFFIKINNGAWATWNNIPNSANWVWASFQSYMLTAGPNTITIAYREDGAAIDKVYLTSTVNIPSGVGGTAENCEILGQGLVSAENKDLVVYPNPLTKQDDLHIQAYLNNRTPLKVLIYNTLGQLVLDQNMGVRESGTFNHTIPMSRFASGMYILKLQTDTATVSQKIIKK